MLYCLQNFDSLVGLPNSIKFTHDARINNDLQNKLVNEGKVEPKIENQDSLIFNSNNIQIQESRVATSGIKKSQKFFSMYRNRYLIFSILNYLNPNEILQCCYINKLLYLHLKKKLEKQVISTYNVYCYLHNK